MKRSRLVFEVLGFACTGLVFLCCESSNNQDPSDSCDPGTAQACTCSDGSAGVQYCTENGTWGECECEVDTDTSTADTDTDSDEDDFEIPEETCPEGTFELNIRDVWSGEFTPSLNAYEEQPNIVMIKDQSDTALIYGAKLEPEECEFYEVCLPTGIGTVIFEGVNPDTECGDAETRSSPFDLSEYSQLNRIEIKYEGTDIEYHYYQAGWQGENPIGPGAFAVTELGEEPEYEPVPEEDWDWDAPECNDLSNYKVLHIRWPWSSAEATGLSGSGCEDEQAGITTPPYPSALRISHQGGCAETLALLERQDGLCPWYRLLIPEDLWQGSIKIDYPDFNAMLFTPSIDLPETDADELWLVYEGAPDDDSNDSNCMNWSQRPNVYHYYTLNLGPGYPGCGGEPVPEDNCADIRPIGHQIIHFRYIWAGQKTFTYFPQPEFMPYWIVLEVNGGGGDKDVICWREADSPWFRCPVPTSEFYEGATWRGVDKTRNPEWNTVEPRNNFPSTPGTYWLRWTYGKPDIPETSIFEFTDYYPDGVEWGSTGAWGDDFCFSEDEVDRPPIESDGYFPWNETDYQYDFGSSIAKWYPNSDSVQTLLDYIVYERYLIWKENYIRYDEDACGSGTARVARPEAGDDTVSEGQGYGMAITAAIGDKALFEKLWKFVRHYLSQSEKKYCGGLMGWMWQGPDNCRPLDSPCDPDTEGCGGNGDSAFDGDVDIAIGLVYAAWQWPEYTNDALDWLLRMECEINNQYDGNWYYATPGDTWDKSCSGYPEEPCYYEPGYNGTVNLSYYAPGFFRAFGELLMNRLDPAVYSPFERKLHMDFWYKAAETVWEMTERCYDSAGTHQALYTDWGHYDTPCDSNSDNYNWARALWRVAVDVAWYGNQDTLEENTAGSSDHFSSKTRMQAKMDAIQDFFALVFPVNNPGEANANRFSTICQDLDPSGSVSSCDPAYGHNSYFVNTAMCAFATHWDNDSQTTVRMRQEALEEAISSSIMNDRYYQESIGVYTLLFLTGNFPKPFSELTDDSGPV